MKETEIEGATPEQLMRMLDGELLSHRSQQKDRGRNRAIIMVAGLLFIVIGAGVALLVLDQMLAEMKQNGASHASPAPAQTNN